jgi:hypothetical protein
MNFSKLLLMTLEFLKAESWRWYISTLTVLHNVDFSIPFITTPAASRALNEEHLDLITENTTPLVDFFSSLIHHGTRQPARTMATIHVGPSQ